MNSKICPICGKEYMEHPAISRRDNKTEICSECGTHEALKIWSDYIRTNNKIRRRKIK